MIDLLKKLDDSVYKSTLQKLLSQANDKMTSLGEGNQKEDLAQIIAFLKNEFEHIDELSVGNDVEATASGQQIPVEEVKERESDSPSLSSEDDDFSKLEGNKSDCSAGTSSDSNSNSPFEKISEEGHETRISVIDTVKAEATANGTISSNSVPCTLRVELTSEDEFLSIEIEDVNNDINVNQPTGHVEQVANENIKPKSVANKQASNSNKIYTTENSVKWPTVATWMFSVNVILALAAATAAYFALVNSLLVAEVAAGIGAFCIVAAIAVHYYNKAPSGPLKGPDVEEVVRNAAVGAS